jgi:deazaflavin-dependent oxidoreductase (nitroreductase family)
MKSRTKYKLMTTLERVNNRLTRAALRRGWAPPFFALLETTGRKSRRPRQTPVGLGMRKGDTVFWLIAAHGRRADYVRNIEHDPHVRVKVRGVWHDGVATILPDDDADARSRTLPYKWDAAIGRAMASDPLTIRIDLS